MKKNILTMTLLASFATSIAYAQTAPNLEAQVQASVQAQTMALPPQLEPTELKLEEGFNDVSVEDVIKSRIKDPETEISNINKEIFESETQRNLDRYNKVKSYLLEKQEVTRVLEEKVKQNKIIRDENAAILKELESVKNLEEKKEEEKRIEEERIMEEKATHQIVTDNVIVYLVYGNSGNRFAELVVNGTKYHVQKGYKTEGFTVLNVDNNGVLLEKNGVEQYVNVSAQPTTISTQEPIMAEPARQPNIIKPYELK